MSLGTTNTGLTVSCTGDYTRNENGISVKAIGATTNPDGAASVTVNLPQGASRMNMTMQSQYSHAVGISIDGKTYTANSKSSTSLDYTLNLGAGTHMLTFNYQSGGWEALYKTIKFTPAAPEQVKVICGKTEQEDISGIKSVTIDGKAVNIGNYIAVNKGSSVPVVVTPEDGYYVSGYKIGSIDTKLTGDGQKTITLSAAQTASDITIYPAVSKVESEVKETERTNGNLEWANRKGENNFTLSYQDALGFNYNAQVKDFMLNRNFGMSWTYGVDPLENPKMYSTASFNNGTAITVGDSEKNPVSLGEIGGQHPQKGTNLDSNIKASDVVPGRFTQTVTADYYTATGICGNHWYHVGGVVYHEDGMNRTINIAKDTLSLSLNKNAFDYTGEPEVVPTVTPASANIEGTKASVDDSNLTYTYYVKGTDGNYTELDNAPVDVGEYKVTAAYVGDTYIQSYGEGNPALAATFTISYTDVQKFMIDTFGAIPGTDHTFRVPLATSEDFIKLARDNKKAILAAQQTFAGLTRTERDQINALIGTGDDAFTYNSLLAELEAQDVEASDKYKAVANLTEVTAKNKEALDAALAAWEAMKLDGAKTSPTGSAMNDKLTAMKAAADWANTYNDVLTKDAPLSTDDISKLLAAQEAYTNLSPAAAKAYVPEEYTKRLTAAVSANTWLEANDAIINADTVTEDDVEAIERAITEFNNLSNDAKEMLGPDYLVNLENKLVAAQWQAGVMGKELTLDEIRAAMDEYNKMTDAQKALVDSANLAGVMDAQARLFVQTYVSDKDGNVYKEANASNYEQILSGKADWDNMSDAEKKAIDEALVAAGSKPYLELLKEAEALKNSTDGFIQKHLTGHDGQIFKTATRANYKQILGGLDDWNKLTQEQKDAINAKLLANGGKTYEELLKMAQDIQKQIEAEKKASATKTGDSAPIALYSLLAMFSLAGVALTERKKRYM